MLRAALGDTLEAIDELLLRSVVLLTAPMARLYWKDYLGLDPAEAAATAGWASAPSSAAPGHQPKQPPGPDR